MIKSLFERRVPQIFGLYVGATWMMIEIGDWVVERFQLTPNLTSYVFVAMVALIPAVVVFAWNHGAPGKDEWTKVEKTLIPMNLAIALAAAAFFVGPPQPVSATEIREVVDETGAVQTFEVPKAGFHRKISVFFLSNESADPDLDWLSYGIPLMVAHDLMHESALVSASTAFDSVNLKQDLEARGFGDARGAPRALERQLARSRLSDAMISGAVEKLDGVIAVKIKLLDVESGSMVAEITETGTDWLGVADRISQAIRQALRLEDQGAGENNPLSENLSGSITAVQHFIEAETAMQLRNDYPEGIRLLNLAIAADPSFAEAYKVLGRAQYLSGGSQDALVSIDQALAHDYRLSPSSRFEVRAYRYQVQGDNVAARRVLEMWTEVESENPRAFNELGRFLVVQGNAHDEARAAFARVLALNPGAHDAILRQAVVEQTRGDFQTAAELVGDYLEARPADPDAHILLAAINIGAGDMQAARAAYQDAGILGADRVLTRLGVAQIDIRMGNVLEAQNSIDALLSENLTPQQRVQVLNVLFDAQYVQGKIKDTFTTLAQMDEAAEAFMPPLVRIIQIGASEAGVMNWLGDTDGARARIEEMRGQMQPPFDAYLAFSTLGIEAEAGDKAAFMTALETAESFYEMSSNEVLAPFLFWAQAYGAWWNEDFEKASQKLNDAMEAYNKSFIKTVAESAANLETKLEMYRLMLKLGDLDAAARHTRELIEIASALGTARLLLARILVAQGEPEEARRELGVALEIWREADPEYTRFRDARELLATLD